MVSGLHAFGIAFGPPHSVCSARTPNNECAKITGNNVNRSGCSHQAIAWQLNYFASQYVE
jgi:hypothetical protein